MAGLMLDPLPYSNINGLHFFTGKALNKHELYKLYFACVGEKSGGLPAVH